jgi:hypothetical protein
MISAWTANIANDPEAKASFEDYLNNNSRLLTRLKDIIEEKEKVLSKSELSLTSYDSIGWSHKQAHINGRRAELAELKQLITI